MMSSMPPEDERRRRHSGRHISLMKTGNYTFGSTMQIGYIVVDPA